MVMKLIRTKFVGTEIIESDSESITIKVLTATPEMKLELAFNRMFKSTSNMFSETMHAIEKGDSEYAQEIVHMDDEIDRFSYYLTRNLVMALDDSNILSALGLEKTSQAIGYKRIINCVERIADHITTIAKLVVDMDKNISKIPKDILSAYQKTIELFDKTMILISERNYSQAEKHAEEIEALIDETNALVKSTKSNSEASVVYQNLIYQNRRILDYILDVSEVVMNDTVDSIVSMKTIENTEA
jgi:phosphate uptake regulator